MNCAVVTSITHTLSSSIYSRQAFRRFVQLCMASAILLPFSIAAQPVVREYYNYYPVAPESPEDILAALQAASPIEQDGEVFFGFTDTRVSWQFWWQQEHGRCWVDRVTTVVDVTYTLPELDESTSNTRINAIWRQWYPRLVLHETGHRDLAIDTAVDIENTILAMAANSSCEQLERDGNTIAAEHIANLQQLDKQYDSASSHGKTQGAQLSSHL